MGGHFDVGTFEGQFHTKRRANLSSPRKSDSKRSCEKRSSIEFGERHDYGYKRAKMRDLESVCRSEEINRDQSKDLKKNEDHNRFHYSDEEISQVTEERITLNLDTSLAKKSTQNTFPSVINRLPDLNSEACIAQYSTSIDFDLHCAETSDAGNESILSENHINCFSSTGIGLDLNAYDVSSADDLGTNYSSSEIHDYSKSRDISESGSSAGPLEEKDALRLWKEIKKNGYLSSNHGGIPRPKSVRKSKNYLLERQMELAKKEQVDRFAKIAAPTGLLNDLNPGIINHVRNRKQVHSIIEALVKSENFENNHAGKKHDTSVKSTIEEDDVRKHLGNVNVLSSHGYEHSNSSSGSGQTREYTMPMARFYSISDGQGSESERENLVLEKRASLLNSVCEEDTLALKLSWSSKASRNSSSPSQESSGSFICVSSLSVNAANVASQWLELLHLDIKGRLSALKRSKKRVQAVINVELPFLIRKELSEIHDNGSCSLEDFSDGFSDNAEGNSHQERWTRLFYQMNTAISEEEAQLESWLNRVKEMQTHCDQGLQEAQSGAARGYQLFGGPENHSRSSKMNGPERELAVGAAAASIYSTCNFLMENMSCFCS